MTVSEQCPHGHIIRSSNDRLSTGYCRECQRQQNRRYRQKQRAAMDLVKALEAEGLIWDDQVPISQIVASLVSSRIAESSSNRL
ncbi:hypothetical protein [Rhodococcus sp. SG20037]|uniref:hypothetical protein n=1 Tax=Rhodococcus sp. SG20037 TaxID=3074148 RepID=UPI00287FA22A|nr:hypothetical protein [Rhodococcus sp. SG20037]WNF42360.1 hypothetical protein RHP72_02805 [Rhodococcus sp. SG20037]